MMEQALDKEMLFFESWQERLDRVKERLKEAQGQHVVSIKSNGEPLLMEWTIGVGHQEVPMELTGGKRCVIVGIESVTHPGRCSKAYMWAEPGTHFVWHVHLTYSEHVMIIDGHGANRRDPTKPWHPIHKGDFFYFEPREPHEFIVAEDSVPMQAWLWFYADDPESHL